MPCSKYLEYPYSVHQIGFPCGPDQNGYNKTNLFSRTVEIDGDYWHSSAKKQSQDKRKDSFLANKGLKVLRLKECDINKDISFEVAKIKELINAKVTI